jgi:hypothetical protein
MTCDFTLSRYEALCKALIFSSHRSITVQEYIQGQVAEPFIILRHDVDRRPEMALEMAGIERDLGIRAAYYMGMISWKIISSEKIKKSQKLRLFIIFWSKDFIMKVTIIINALKENIADAGILFIKTIS